MKQEFNFEKDTYQIVSNHQLPKYEFFKKSYQDIYTTKDFEAPFDKKDRFFNFTLKDGDRIKLPNDYYELARCIKESEYIYELEDDWDENDSLGYNFDTWKKAIVFLTNNILNAIDFTIYGSTEPQILPGPKGSIDLLWENTNFQLLINIPKEDGKNPTFYGNDHSKSEIRGELKTSDQTKIINYLFNLL